MWADPACRTVAERFAFTGRARPWRATRPVACGYAWRAAAPTASVVLLHGVQSHAQWFSETAEDLVARGLAVYALDRRGSGSSGAVRGDIEHHAQWLEEIRAAVALARREQPSLPVHLAGHCFGANLGLAFCLSRPRDVDSLVMLTPGLHITPDYGLAVKLAILGAAALGGSRRFPVPQDDDMFTRDPEVLEWIGRDRLGARTLTARCLLQIASLGAWIRRDVGRLEVPLLVLAASRDRIADNERSRRLLQGRLGARCRWVTFEAEHFLLAEPCRDQVIDALLDWTAREAG
jgi:alpha-beta hydrolase superfamily lysophospholipase